MNSGLRQNWKQFSLLLWINACIGGMVGMERIVFPEIAQSIFNIDAALALVQFVVSFGLAKAITNLYTGKIITYFGRKPVLIVGWVISLTVPILMWVARDWWQIVLINLLLGISQGLLWSTAVIMKIELAGEHQRGLAIGLNEFTGYLSVGIVAWCSTLVLSYFGLIPHTYILGIILSLLGLFSTVFLLKETVPGNKIWLSNRIAIRPENQRASISKKIKAISGAGLVNNWNDALMWAIAPSTLAKQISLAETAVVLTVYPITWGVGQLFTGWLSDKIPHATFIFWGMFIQSIGLVCFAFGTQYELFIASSLLLGIGTAMVYPTFMAAIVQNLSSDERVQSLSVYRFWRDMGYAIGAISAGILMDVFGFKWSLLTVAVFTALSGWFAAKSIRSARQIQH